MPFYFSIIKKQTNTPIETGKVNPHTHITKIKPSWRLCHTWFMLLISAFFLLNQMLRQIMLPHPYLLLINISKTWMYSHITRIFSSRLTKLTGIPWYHQIPSPCKNSPVIPHLLSPFAVGLFYSGSGHCIWVLCFLSILYSQQTLPFWICISCGII